MLGEAVKGGTGMDQPIVEARSDKTDDNMKIGWEVTNEKEEDDIVRESR